MPYHLICPECGKQMQLMMSKTGGQFYGCTGYPSCTRTIGAHEDGRPKAIFPSRKAAHKAARKQAARQNRPAGTPVPPPLPAPQIRQMTLFHPPLDNRLPGGTDAVEITETQADLDRKPERRY